MMTLAPFCFGAHFNRKVLTLCRNALDKEAA